MQGRILRTLASPQPASLLELSTTPSRDLPRRLPVIAIGDIQAFARQEASLDFETAHFASRRAHGLFLPDGRIGRGGGAQDLAVAAALAVHGDGAAGVGHAAPDEGMDLCVDLGGEVVALVVASGRVVTALLAAEVVLVVDGEGPGADGTCGEEEGGKESGECKETHGGNGEICSNV